jgi:hypothetical protein
MFSGDDVIATYDCQCLPSTLSLSVELVQHTKGDLIVVANNCGWPRLHFENRTYGLTPTFWRQLDVDDPFIRDGKAMFRHGGQVAQAPLIRHCVTGTVAHERDSLVALLDQMLGCKREGTSCSALTPSYCRLP